MRYICINSTLEIAFKNVYNAKNITKEREKEPSKCVGLLIISVKEEKLLWKFILDKVFEKSLNLILSFIYLGNECIV